MNFLVAIAGIGPAWRARLAAPRLLPPKGADAGIADGNSAMASSTWPDRIQWIKDSSSNSLKRPCVRNALMAGIAAGTMMGIHKYRVGRTVPQACMAWGFTFVLGSNIHLMACSYRLRPKLEKLERHMAATGVVHESKAPEQP